MKKVIQFTNENFDVLILFAFIILIAVALVARMSIRTIVGLAGGLFIYIKMRRVQNRNEKKKMIVRARAAAIKKEKERRQEEENKKRFDDIMSQIQNVF